MRRDSEVSRAHQLAVITSRLWWLNIFTNSTHRYDVKIFWQDPRTLGIHGDRWWLSAISLLNLLWAWWSGCLVLCWRSGCAADWSRRPGCSRSRSRKSRCLVGSSRCLKRWCRGWPSCWKWLGSYLRKRISRFVCSSLYFGGVTCCYDRSTLKLW